MTDIFKLHQILDSASPGVEECYILLDVDFINEEFPGIRKYIGLLVCQDNLQVVFSLFGNRKANKSCCSFTSLDTFKLI